jgi:hypothetical protein
MESILSHTMLRLRTYYFLVPALLLLFAKSGYCSDVLYIDTHAGPSYPRQQLEAAAKVYGLDLNVIVLSSAADSARAIAAIKDFKSIAIVLTADALESSWGNQLFVSASQAEAQRPVMITGIGEQTDAGALAKWSGGAISGSKKWAAAVQYLTFGQQSVAHWLIAATDGADRHPVFAMTGAAGHQLFFSTIPGAIDAGIPADLLRGPFVFPVLASDLLFLRYAAGDRAWHSPGHYANLTIDDIWLREPYGYVDYYGLLREMQQHNFHTTLAFIPWNYDRSQPALVTLFREHSDRYSISVHGNNHEHQEFGPFSDRPLAGQITDMKQGLARMAAFQKLTNLSWDPVMIFPHKMSPQGTLASLKRYNYWATVNADNVPSDVEAPADPAFALRPATLAFADFPSIRRYSAETPVPDWLLAMDAFLGNPMFFYCHESYFADGIGAFDGLVDKVNRLQPDTEWRGLGFITQHLYLEKLRDDGNYDVQLLSSTASLTNDLNHDTVFYLEKQEDGATPFKVMLGGQSQPYDFENGQLRLQVPVHAGATQLISIVYQNDFVLSKTDISKSSLRIAAIRHASDFRDDVVSRSAPGRWFIRSYVANRSKWNHTAEGLAALSILVALYWRRVGKKKQWAARGNSVA